ncbi:WhiB family transcriptional regulator [Amycolatopsis japonica]|uniref:WhiB family transcriptional regulator n=1 Tax=Amycolatopsis japonica TaxID=208439 RepID=UPI0033F844BD
MEMSMAGDLSEAACRGEDPELFFPVTETGPGARQAARAKAVCARCPVVSACLAYAVDNGLAHGVFGGLTGSERRQLIRVGNAA